MSNVVTNTFLPIFLFYGLVDVAAIVIGLLIFYKGRAYVRKKYGQ